jgi:hypothetical protein
MLEKIDLSIKELNKIQETISKFDGVTYVTMTNDRSGGIGNTLRLEFDYKVNDVVGKFSTVITDFNDW